MGSFSRMATVMAATRRSPDLDSDGQRGEPEPYLAGIPCTPLDPAEDQQARDLAFRLRQELNSPITLLQTFVDSAADIGEGDVLVVDLVEYPVRGVDRWEWRGSRYLRLLLERSQP